MRVASGWAALLLVHLSTACVRAPVPSAPEGLSVQALRTDSVRQDSVYRARFLPVVSALDTFAWLKGHWAMSVRVFATASAPERQVRGTLVAEPILSGSALHLHVRWESGQEDADLLTYSPANGRWVKVGVARSGDGWIEIADEWRGDQIVFLSPPQPLLGKAGELRAVWTKVSDREFRVVYAERLPDGTWRNYDESTFRKLAP